MFDNTPLKSQQKRWLVTFSDLATLLLTFFVMMLSMAQIDIQRFESAIRSIRVDRGVQLDELLDPALVNINDSSKVESEQIQKDIKDMLTQLQKIIRENKLEGEVAMEVSKNGIRVRVKGRILFDSGQAELKNTATKFVAGIADALKKYEFFLLVEGHTDSIPIDTDKYPSNWELSAARATNVVRHIMEYGIAKNRLSAIGYSDNYPLGSNETDFGRTKNRRVEFIFTKFPTRVVI